MIEHVSGPLPQSTEVTFRDESTANLINVDDSAAYAGWSRTETITLPDTPPPHDSSGWGGWDAPLRPDQSRWAQKGWAVTRLLAVPDEMGVGAEYLWRSQPWDFKVQEEVPADGRYVGWGSWKLSDGSDLTTDEAAQLLQIASLSAQDSALNDVLMSDPPANGLQAPLAPSSSAEPSTTAAVPLAAPTPPRSPLHGAVETVSLDELREDARPHDSMFYNPTTRHWVLFASVPPRIKVTSTATAHDTWRPCEVSSLRIQALNIPPPFQPATVASEGQAGEPAVKLNLSHEARQELKVWESTQGHDVVVSSPTFYPSVISEALWLQLEEQSQPLPGESGAVAFNRGVHLIWRVLDGLLFLGQTKALPVTGKNFSKAMTWTPTAHAIFVDTLGFVFHADATGEVMTLSPPDISRATEQGREARQRLLRAWLEAGLILESVRATERECFVRGPSVRSEACC